MATSTDIHSALQKLQQQHNSAVTQSHHSTSLHTMLQQYNHELFIYCYNKILLDILEQLCCKHEASLLPSSQYTVIDQLMSLHHIIQSNDIQSHTDANAVYNLNIQQLLDSHNTSHINTKAITSHTLFNNNIQLSTAVLNDLNDELLNKISLLYDIIQPSTDELNQIENGGTRSAQSLLQLLKHILQSNTELQHQYHSLQSHHSELQLSQCQQSAELLHKLHEYYQLIATVQYSDHTIDTRLLLSKVNALYAKLQRHKYQLLHETYNDHTLPVLRNIEQNIDNDIKQLTQRKYELQRQLNKYNSVGLGYNELVNQYTAIQSQITKQQVIIDQFDG